MAEPLRLSVELGFADWFFLPGPGAGWIGLSVVLLGLLILGLLACQWRVRVPGPVTTGERSRSIVPRMFGVLALLAPVLIIFAVAYLHFPVSEPQVMVLSSRSRSIDETGRSGWGEGWSQLLDEAESDSVMDAGGLVDRVCQAVAENPPPGGWLRGDPAVIEHLSAVVHQALLAEVRGMSAIPVDSARQAVGSVSELPAWVVESIELATLKALTQSHNVSQVLVRCEPRLTISGETWSTAAQSYLESGLTRITETRVNLQKADSRAPVLLSAFVDVGGTNPDRYAMLFFQVDPTAASALSDREWAEASTVTLYTDHQDRSGRILRVAELSRDKQIQACRVPLPPITARATAFIVHPASGQRLAWPQSRVDLHDEGVQASRRPVVLLCNRGEELRWRQTLNQLLTKPPFDAWRDLMQKSMLLTLPRNADDMTITATPPLAGVVIDVRGEGLWVYDAQLRDKVAQMPQAKGLDEARKKVPQLTRSGAEGVPGLGSWDGLMLPASDRFVLPLPHDEGETASALAITEQFQFGRQGLFPERPARMVSSRMLQKNTSEGMISGRATYMGLIPEAHGLLAIDDKPPASYNKERFLAFWTSVFRAVKRAPASEHGPLVADDSSKQVGPAVLLSAMQLSELRATAMRFPMLILAAGLAMFSGWVLASQWFSLRIIKP